jgi:hypothetical protein
MAPSRHFRYALAGDHSGLYLEDVASLWDIPRRVALRHRPHTERVRAA